MSYDSTAPKTPTFKLLLMGDSGTGKSSLLLRFVDNKFLGEDAQTATIGVDFKVKTIRLNEQTVKLTIWDTAGQERFRTLTSSYYRGAQGIILVYDITREETFKHLKDWMIELDTYSNIEDSIKMVVGNKVDKDVNRVISRESGAAYAKSIGALFTESSAKSNIGVQQAFEELVLKIIETPSLTQSSSQAASASKNLIMTDQGEQSGCSC